MFLSLLYQDDAVPTAVNHRQKPLGNLSNVWLNAPGGLMDTADFTDWRKRTQLYMPIDSSLTGVPGRLVSRTRVPLGAKFFAEAIYACSEERARRKEDVWMTLSQDGHSCPFAKWLLFPLR